jgi:AmiR/NasT family two-component response regulator
MENTEYYYDIASGNWRVMEQLEETVKELKKEVATRNPISESKALRIFENFIGSLKG